MKRSDDDTIQLVLAGIAIRRSDDPTCSWLEDEELPYALTSEVFGADCNDDNHLEWSDVLSIARDLVFKMRASEDDEASEDDDVVEPLPSHEDTLS